MNEISMKVAGPGPAASGARATAATPNATIAASDAVPTPASTITGTVAFSRISCRFHGFRMPIPDPISDASGITATQPTDSSTRAWIGSSLQ